MTFSPAFVIGLIAHCVLAAAQDFQNACQSFKPAVDNATVELVEFVSEGQAISLPYRDKSCGGPGKSSRISQDVCRVALNITTSARSSIEFEAWLPRNWTGRFIATGNGGIGGCIDYSSMSYSIEHGFAVVGSNNGHNGTGGRAFFHNPDVVADFAGRSLHTSAVAGKVVTDAFYGKAHQKSYYLGCSQGGRQGVGAAEKYPEDFDGIVAGSPALDFDNLISWRASFYPITGTQQNPDFIKPAVWAGLIHDEVLKQCDALDGLKDGIIEDADSCQFRPETLMCQANITESCLSSTQVDIVRRVFSPLKYDNGTIIYSGMNPGSEIRAVDRLYAGKPFSDSEDWFRYVVYSNESWDPLSFSLRDAAASAALNPSNVRTFPSELNAFKARGGRLISYHGQEDQQITSLNTERWYEHLKEGMSATSTQLDTFLRFFRISGMNHCSGGPGAWMIGQSSGQKLPFESQYNVLAAIVAWVEQGKAPDTLEGTKFQNDSTAAAIAFQRRHCRYPLKNKFKGHDQGFIANTLGTQSPLTVDDWECVSA